MRTNFLGWLIFLSYVYVPAAQVEEELVVEQLRVLEGDHQQTLWHYPVSYTHLTLPTILLV